MSDLANISGRIDHQGPWGGMVVQEDRRRARFENVPTLHEIKSKEAGRPIYEDKVVLFVRHPGERDETAVMALPHHQYEFPAAWASFQAGQSPDANGTPLNILFPTNPSLVMHMRALHIFTVEALAGCGEEGIRRLGMGAREYVAQAQKFIEAAQSAAPLHQMEAALQERDDKIAMLEEQMKILIEGAQKRGRKRPTEDEGDDA